ncbi:MAG: hypothetical protein RI962_133, partial [Pseudomonadota bacterium]
VHISCLSAENTPKQSTRTPTAKAGAGYAPSESALNAKQLNTLTD